LRKLTDIERNACIFLAHHGNAFRPSDHDLSAETIEVCLVLDMLVKKKRVYVEPTDAGPVYRLTYQGIEDAA
jgi:hypothetical protein